MGDVPGDAASVRPLRVAVVGAGPSGLYAADALTKQDENLLVDVLDRLPTPYGLVRYGVAPDHHKIKSVTETLRRVLEQPVTRFLGCVELGRDLTREELLSHYDAVVYATGAAVDQRLGVPGEDLPGSCPATELVSWYSGHPDAVQPFPLSCRSVVVVGVGNVAVDVARILVRDPEDLVGTDVPEHVLAALRASQVREVTILGRRGPEHAKFTTKELRELGELAGVDTSADPRDLPDADPVDADRLVRANLAVIRDFAAREATAAPRSLRLRFWSRPVEVRGEGRAETLVVERTRLDESGRVVGTGETVTLPAEVVLRAVGYRSTALPGVPFDDDLGVVRNEGGRVLGDDGRPLPGEYVAGWLKRGPTGVIGTNKSDAAETVAALLADLRGEGGRRAASSEPVDALLVARGVGVVTYDGWLAIDAEETARGLAAGRTRVKVSDWDELRRIGTAGSRAVTSSD